MNSFAGSILGENDDKINWFKLEKAFSSQDAFFFVFASNYCYQIRFFVRVGLKFDCKPHLG